MPTRLGDLSEEGRLALFKSRCGDPVDGMEREVSKILMSVLKKHYEQLEPEAAFATAIKVRVGVGVDRAQRQSLCLL